VFSKNDVQKKLADKDSYWQGVVVKPKTKFITLWKSLSIISTDKDIVDH
jgi:hypothetical protein